MYYYKFCCNPTDNTDYNPGPYTVTFIAGMTRASFNITINDDNVVEGNESFTLSIDSFSPIGSATVGSPFQATVTIYDDDCELWKITKY